MMQAIECGDVLINKVQKPPKLHSCESTLPRLLEKSKEYFPRWTSGSHYINEKESVKGLLEWLLSGLNIHVSQSALPRSGQCVTPLPPASHTLSQTVRCLTPHFPALIPGQISFLCLSSGNLDCFPWDCLSLHLSKGGSWFHGTFMFHVSNEHLTIKVFTNKSRHTESLSWDLVRPTLLWEQLYQ